MPVIYAARWVVPVSSALIEDGAVAVEEARIVAVGTRRDVLSRFPDVKDVNFGEAAIIPGLVNAHSHLELSVMRGFLEPEEHDFFAWLTKLTLARISMTDDDLRASAILGAIEAARAGITCVADSSSLARQTVRAVSEVGLRGIVYQESFGPDPKSAIDNVNKLRDQIEGAQQYETALVRVGVSPHAPYTVSGPQLEMISRLALERKLPLMMHAAESRAEESFMQEGSGPFAAGLRKRGIEWQAPRTSSIEYLAGHGILETKPLFAHCITVDDHDLEIIREHGAAIAHCPKSNAKLGHGRAPFGSFVSMEIACGFGSDSVASNNTCDILEEARFAVLLARLANADEPATGAEDNSISAEQALFTATLGGARALGLDDQIGVLAKGMQADLAVVRLDGIHQTPVEDPVATIVFSSSARDVALTMVAGKEVYRDGAVPAFDESATRSLIKTIRTKLQLAESPLC